MFGANKTATATGGTLQLRALDWDVDGMAQTHVFVHGNRGNCATQVLQGTIACTSFV